MSTGQPENAATLPAPRILLYSDDVDAREQVRLAVGRRLRRGAPDIEWVEVATAPAVITQRRGRRSGPADPRRRGRQGRRHGPRAPAQGRDLPLPAGPRAHRSAAGRLARLVVQRRGRRQPARSTRSSCTRPSPHSSRPGPSPDDRRSDLVGPVRHARQPAGPHRRADRVGDGRDHERRGVDAAGRGVPHRAQDQGRDRHRADGLADTMLQHAVRITVPGRTLDIVGTGGDRSHTVNISTMSALVVAGAGLTVVKHGNRAASSSSGLGGRARGARHPAGPPTGTRRRAGDRGRHHVLLRAGVPPVVPAHRPGPQRAGHRDRVQLPRPADQPGAAAVRGDRRRRRPDGPAHGGGPGRARRERARVPRRGRSRRDRAHRADPDLGGPGRRRAGVASSTGPISASPGSSSSPCAARRPTTTPTSRAVCSPVSRGPCARPSCSTPPPRSSPTARCRARRRLAGRAVRRGRRSRARVAGQRARGRRAGAVAGGQRGLSREGSPRGRLSWRRLSPRGRGRTPAPGRAGCRSGTRCRSGCAGRRRPC